MRALLARAQGYDAHRNYRDRYRTMATSLGYEGHMNWAEARHCQLEQSEGDFRRFASAIHQVACDV